jgi:hypothetical protein
MPLYLDALVDDYIENHQPSRTRELRFFCVLRTDEEAVSYAALAQLPSGKRHSHQRRIPEPSLAESRRRLLGNLPALRATATFQELIDLVDVLIRPLDRVGELVVYDTAVRIGARFGLEPEVVYLHRGTRDGVRNLGLDSKRETIEIKDLPEAVQRLTPGEAEDFLCIYKKRFRPVRQRGYDPH